MMWVQPSAMAARKGTASKTAASTRRFPRCRIGRPATCMCSTGHQHALEPSFFHLSVTSSHASSTSRGHTQRWLVSLQVHLQEWAGAPQYVVKKMSLYPPTEGLMPKYDHKVTAQNPAKLSAAHLGDIGTGPQAGLQVAGICKVLQDDWLQRVQAGGHHLQGHLAAQHRIPVQRPLLLDDVQQKVQVQRWRCRRAMKTSAQPREASKQHRLLVQRRLLLDDVQQEFQVERRRCTTGEMASIGSTEDRALPW